MSQTTDLQNNPVTKCQYLNCKVFDFLPTICKFCKQSFCSDHSKPDSHQCTQDPLRSKSCDPRLISIEKKQQCSQSTCKKQLTEINKIYCKYCQKYFCTGHRVPEVHNCPGIEESNIIVEERQNKFKADEKKVLQKEEGIKKEQNQQIKKNDAVRVNNYISENQNQNKKQKAPWYSCFICSKQKKYNQKK